MRNTTLVNDNTRLNLAVNQIMVDFYFAKKDFSAHDVTKVLRDKYPQEEIDHDTVKNIVHTDLRNDDRFKRVNKGGYFLYEIVQAAPAAVIVPTTPVQVKTPNTNGITLKVGAERRVCIPKKVVSLIGGPSEQFYISRFGINEFVLAKTKGIHSKCHPIKSDNHANIRVRTMWPVGQDCTCEVVNGQIVLKS